MTSMMCEPSERDLVHALRRGVEAARAAGRGAPAELRDAALGALRASWPHLPPEAAAAAVARHLPDLPAV